MNLSCAWRICLPCHALVDFTEDDDARESRFRVIRDGGMEQEDACIALIHHYERKILYLLRMFPLPSACVGTSLKLSKTSILKCH